jgi:uncharacterized protein
MKSDFNGKMEKLKGIISRYKKPAVAFSGGVDSSFLIKLCYDIMGENSAAITIVSPMNPKSEMDDAKRIALHVGIKHLIIDDDSIDEAVAENPPDRCYHCKKIEFGLIIAKAHEIGCDVVFDGSNHDDISDYRPGMKAITELSVVSPLLEAGFIKDEIRDFSKSHGLPTWDKPSFACLASRVPYGEKITKEVLKRIENSEDYLRELGFIQFRVRSHADTARIEVSPEERIKFFDIKLIDEISAKLKSFGYLYVTFDLEGYKTGSMNRAIAHREKK